MQKKPHIVNFNGIILIMNSVIFMYFILHILFAAVCLKHTYCFIFLTAKYETVVMDLILILMH